MAFAGYRVGGIASESANWDDAFKVGSWANIADIKVCVQFEWEGNERSVGPHPFTHKPLSRELACRPGLHKSPASLVKRYGLLHEGE